MAAPGFSMSLSPDSPTGRYASSAYPQPLTLALCAGPLEALLRLTVAGTRQPRAPAGYRLNGPASVERLRHHGDLLVVESSEPKPAIFVVRREQDPWISARAAAAIR